MEFNWLHCYIVRNEIKYSWYFLLLVTHVIWEDILSVNNVLIIIAKSIVSGKTLLNVINGLILSNDF